MKTVMWIIGAVVLLVLGVGTYLVLNSGNLIERGIETLGPEYLGTGVHVDRVELSLVEGSGDLIGLQIDNPDGYEGPYVMRLGQIGVVLDTDHLSQELVVIKEMRIDGAELAVISGVLSGKKTNLQTIMDNLDAAAKSEGGGLDEGSDGSDMKIIIDRFAFTNAKASVSSEVLGELELSIADVHLTDIGRKTNGATVGEALRQILRPVYQSVSREMLSQGFDLEGVETSVKKQAVEKLTEKLGGLKKLTDRLGQ